MFKIFQTICHQVHITTHLCSDLIVYPYPLSSEYLYDDTYLITDMLDYRAIFQYKWLF